MIEATDLFAIGYVAKTHGIKGELNVRLDTDYNPEDFRFVIFEIDSLFVPFVVESSRGNADASRLVTLKDVDSIEEAKAFVGKTVYVLKSEVQSLRGDGDEPDDGMYLSDLVGYTLLDDAGTKVGEIVGFNDDTQNFLLEVRTDDRRDVLVPYVDEWVLNLDQDAKTIQCSLPTGLLD